MTEQTRIPASENETWGFYGSLGEQAAQAWPIATRAIAKATGWRSTRSSPFSIVAMGAISPMRCTTPCSRARTLEAAIDAAIQRWMGWTINRTTERALGIPRGLPYLTGFVGHCAILAESEWA